MKVRSFVNLAAVAALLAVSAMAADVTGKWVAKVEGKDGQVSEQVFNLKADGATLTGNVTTPRGESAISEGKVDGDAISFTIVRETPNGTMKMLYKGKVSGDELKLHMEREGGQGRARDFTAKRSS